MVKKSHKKRSDSARIVQGVGIDVESVERFKKFKKNRTNPFLSRVFTKRELAYCFKYADPVPHLAGTFAAKEAVSKAFNGKISSVEVEIVRRPHGAPYALRNKLKIPISISITHTASVAAAIAVG